MKARAASIFLLLILSFSAEVFAAGEFDGISEDSTVSNGKYIIPNEYHVYLTRQVNRDQTGALISVGTFRALAQASQGKFSHLIMLDADQAVVDFNRKQIEILKISASAGEFVANLMGQPQLAAKIQDVLDGRDEIQHVPTHLAPYPMGEYVRVMLRIAAVDPGTTFLRNPAAYESIRAMAMKGNIVAIHGDLGGEKTMTEIGERLREFKIEVGALDLSNAADYIIMYHVTAKFVRNLFRLPFAVNAIVNFTAEDNATTLSGIHHRKTAHLGMWNFFSLPARVYLDEAKKFINAQSPYKDSEYGRFLDPLFETPHFLNKTNRCSTLFAN